MEISDLIAELITNEVDGLLLTGSFARGLAGPYSDYDLKRYFDDGRETEHRYQVHAGRLVSVTDLSYQAARRQLQDPDGWMWAAPGLRQGKILLDRSGLLDALVQIPAPAGERWVLEHFQGWVEEVHKLLNALARDDEEMSWAPRWGLVEGLTRVLAVHLRLTIESENRYFGTVAGAVGEQSRWTQLQRRLLRGGDWRERSRDALELFQETHLILGQPEDPVVSHTLGLLSG